MMIDLFIKNNLFTRRVYSITFILILLYLFFGTGLFHDDYSHISSLENKKFSDFINQKFSYLLIFYYIYWWAYWLLGTGNQWIYDLLKFFTSFLCIWLIYKFASDYLPKDRAFLASIFFIFYPTHESTI